METKTGMRLTEGYQTILDRLGDREPTTNEEANAVLANIRAGFGYVYEDLRTDLENCEPRHRDLVLQNFQELRRNKAMFTKRFGSDCLV
jgi:hypothetical protein